MTGKSAAFVNTLYREMHCRRVYTALENPEHSLAAMLVYGISAYLISVVSGKFILDV